eukprot:59387_1
MNSYPEPTCTTPNSPISPSIGPHKRHFSYDMKDMDDLSVTSVLKGVGFDDCSKIADSLQGTVYRATSTSSKGAPKPYVIKTANQMLCTHSQGVVNGQVYSIKEG